MTDRGEEGRLSALRESEQRFRAILEHAPVMIDAFDERGHCVLWNRECELRLGWSQAEVAAMDDPLAVLYPDPADRERAKRAIEQGDGEFREYNVLSKSGQLRTQRWADFCLPSGAMIGVGYDVTEQAAVEAKLRQAQRMDALGLLAGGIAHDFNNLLSVIVVNAELVGREVTRNPAQAAALAKEIAEAAVRGAQLIKQIMTFSRPGPPRVKPLRLDAVVARSMATLKRLFPATVKLGLDVEPELPTVNADEAEMEQVVLNLANNAHDAVGGRGTISFCLRSAMGPSSGSAPVRPHVVLSVTDDGPGMPPAVRERVFEPFFTTKPLGRGTGLGLSMVYGTVKQHGGVVEVASEPGRGTRFEIWLPVASEEQAPDALADDRAAASLERGVLLVVEDDEAVRRTLSSALRSLGYRVTTATDGADALEVLEENQEIALVISDVVMPEMTGPELFQRIRAKDLQVAFAFTSGHAAEQVGPLDPSIPLLEKPWTVEGLARFVRQCLQNG